MSWVIIDCRDPNALAAFWADVLGASVTERRGPFVFLEPAPTGATLGFQHVPALSMSTGRVHIDLTFDDPLAVAARVEALGGSRAAGYDEGGFLVMTDPEGNLFCLLPRSGAGLDDTGKAHYLDG